MQDDPKLLDMMLEDQLGQRNIYSPGPYWKGYALRMANAIKADGLKDFRSNSAIGKGYADTVATDPLALLTFDSWKSRAYKNIVEFPPFRKKFIEPYIKQNEKLLQQVQLYKDLYYTSFLSDWLSDFSQKFSLKLTAV